jgi:hypothetical protein
MRILVTGSRNFTSPSAIRDALAEAVADQPGPHTLVHGNAKGADLMAAGIALASGWKVESYPADWTRECTERCHHRGGRPTRDDGSGWCPSAGAIRNMQMCQRGADICLAFYARGAKNAGTAQCVKSAGKCEIPVKRFTA